MATTRGASLGWIESLLQLSVPTRRRAPGEAALPADDEEMPAREGEESSEPLAMRTSCIGCDRLRGGGGARRGTGGTGGTGGRCGGGGGGGRGAMPWRALSGSARGGGGGGGVPQLPRDPGSRRAGDSCAAMAPMARIPLAAVRATDLAALRPASLKVHTCCGGCLRMGDRGRWNMCMTLRALSPGFLLLGSLTHAGRRDPIGWLVITIYFKIVSKFRFSNGMLTWGRWLTMLYLDISRTPSNRISYSRTSILSILR